MKKDYKLIKSLTEANQYKLHHKSDGHLFTGSLADCHAYFRFRVMKTYFDISNI